MVKKILSLIIFASTLLINPINSFAQDYYVSNSGDDSNFGISEKSPWKTISKVNSTTFIPGDTIHLKSGNSWREQLKPSSGNENGYITFTSYGEGNKPLLLGSANLSYANYWENTGNNTWKFKQSNITLETDIGNIIFGGGKAIGVKVFRENELKKQNDFWYDKQNGTIKIYSLKNPAELYNSVECALTRNIISEHSKSYIKYDGLALKYGGAHGIGGTDTHHIWIKDCDISYIGGGELSNGVRYGNGIEFWNNAHDNIVENCNIHEIYDAALTNQYNGSMSGVKQYNISYRNNTIWNAEYSYEYFNKSIGGETHNIVFENNTCKDAGNGWGHNQRPDPTGRHINFWNNKPDGVSVKNNTLTNAIGDIVFIQNMSDIVKIMMANNQCH
jgi:hypothetical protein